MGYLISKVDAMQGCWRLNNSRQVPVGYRINSILSLVSNGTGRRRQQPKRNAKSQTKTNDSHHQHATSEWETCSLIHLLVLTLAQLN